MSTIPYFIPTRFVWRFGGKQVSLCGSFTRWVETVPMIPVDQSPGVFAVLVHLPAGYHQYKFIVDGEWRHDETQPFMPDPLGNVNNWLCVRQPDAAGAVPIGMHMASSDRPANTADAAVSRNASQAQPNAVSSSAIHPAQQPQMATDAHGGHMGQPSGMADPSMGVTSAGAAQPGGGAIASGDLGSAGFAARHAGAGRASTDQALPADGVLHGGAGEHDAVLPPIALQDDEPAFTRNKVIAFLNAHTAYELIPESGKVVLVDIDYPVRQAFHALHKQSISSAPLWDSTEQTIVGMISASDFIETLHKLRDAAGSAGDALSDAEMDEHTIRVMREAAAAEGHAPRDLVYCRETDSFSSVVRTLVESRCSMVPILSCEPWGGQEVPTVLHIATLSGVLACLMRHFRASIASLPLLSQPLASMPIGSWAPDSPIGQQGAVASAPGASIKIGPIHTVQPKVPLTTALSMLIEAGISALPVVDASGVLLDVYARGDLTLLARGNAYRRLQYEELTVAQALSLANATVAPQTSGQPDGVDGYTQSATSKRTRLNVCTRQDPLRLVLERLSMPAVRRVVVVHPETARVEGIISLSDVARFMFM